MNTWLEGPAPRAKRGGCFPTGCILIGAFAFVCGIAFLAGGFFGMHYFIAPAAVEEIPLSVLSPNEQQAAEQRWTEFDRLARAGEPAQAEFSVAELDHIAITARGRASLAVVAANGHVRFRLPLGRLAFAGRYTAIAGLLDALPGRITRAEISRDRVLLEANGAAPPAPTPRPTAVPETATSPEPTPPTNPDALTTASPGEL